ncbi:MAG: glycoside hydrolase family 38 C-terminal domain-containing protein, partial [Candidatus Latescibacterota bacterium]
HIDMNWMWSWPETVAVTVDTFATVLRLMEEYPGFRFSQSQASVYAIVEEHRPDLLEQIARRVREGRWEVTASHWVEGDKNLASGEALCRHLLYTRRYMQELFGLQPEDVPVDWSPDTFGHAATVPSYLVRGGVHYVYMHRPGAHGPDRPWLFWWQAPDGSRVLVRNDSRSQYAYNGVVSGAALTRDLLLFARSTGLRDHLFIYGVGDHGGGPTRRDIHQVVDAASWPIFPTVRFSTVREYMDLVAPQAEHLPVLDCELNFEFSGCYTTQTLIKRDNRQGEMRLVDAEFAASTAWAAAGLEYPGAALVRGWRDVLFSHFHDILPGSGVRDTRTYTHGLFQQTVAATAQIEARSLRLLAGRVHTAPEAAAAARPVPASHLVSSAGAGVGFRSAEGALPQSDQTWGQGDRPFVVFNPTARQRAEVVQATIWATRDPAAPLAVRTFVVRDPEGHAVPAQVVESGGYWGHDFAVLAFPVRVPGLGYARYTVCEGGTPASPPAAGAWQLGRQHPCRYSLYERSPEGLENEHLLVEIDPTSGAIVRLVDKDSAVEVVQPERPAAVLEYLVERPHGMTAWLVQHQGAPSQTPKLCDLRRVVEGPHVAALEASFRIGDSDFTVRYEVRAGERRLHLLLRGTWCERGGPQTGVPTLNLVLPLSLEEARAQYEIPFGAIAREYNRREEVPALQWAMVCGTAGGRQAGCLLANDSKHGHSLQGSVLRLTLIRSSYEPDPLPEIGQHEVHLTLRPFGGRIPVSEAIDEGRALNQPLRVVSTDAHAGDWPASGRLLRVESEAAVLSAVKKAEGEEALVVRLYNPTVAPAMASIASGDVLPGRVVRAAEVDLLERPVGEAALRVAGGTVRVEVPAGGITTVRLELERG